MKIHATDLDGIRVLEFETFGDQRGYFREIFKADFYRSIGISDDFVQDNHSRSRYGVLRGLHFRLRRPQAQIVTVMRGRIFDVVVDVRPESPTFARWIGTELSEDGPQQIYMPPGFAHGFCVLTEITDLHYKVSETFDEEDEAGLLWSDPDLGIDWPIEEPLVSQRDAAHPNLRDIERALRHPNESA